jgi:hypothetical protein
MKAVKIVASFLAVLFSVQCLADGDGALLWWMVKPEITVLDQDGSKTVSSAQELGVTDVRVRYISDEGATGYLSFYGLNSDGESVSYYDGSNGMGAELGIGLPASYFGDLSTLSGTQYSFVLELGNYENGSWARTTMVSESKSYSELLANHHISQWDIMDMPEGRGWNPGFYSVVPEPSSGLLTMLGISLLALRRKRRI